MGKALKIELLPCPHGIPPGHECEDCWREAWEEECIERWREEALERRIGEDEEE